MAVTAGVFWISLILSVIGSNADGELRILHSPESLSFSGSSKAAESSLKDIFSASLGLSVEENSQWDGLIITDPFNAPEAIVEVYIDGVSSLGSSAGLKGINYPLVVDEYEPDTYFAIEHRIKQRFNNGGNNLVNIKLSDPSQLESYDHVFGTIKIPKVPKQSLQHLKTSTDEDFMFLSELEILKAIITKIKSDVSADNIPDIYYLRFVSLHALSDFHGPKSLQTKEAKKLLGNALEELSAAFVKAYDGSVLVTVVTTDVEHTRRAVRSLKEGNEETVPNLTEDENIQESVPQLTDEDNKNERLTRDEGYSADYAAIFNIILWFGVIFSFTLIAIVYALIDMDPGRDSIIYRMTSTRMKKEN